jgi:sugar lactone lactonase YvrE
VKDVDLGRALRDVELPRPDRERALAVVRTAFAERERVSWPRRHVRSLALAVAAATVAAAIVAATLSSPGRAVIDNLRKAIGVEHAQPALFSLPSSGRLLVTATSGSWIVAQDGSNRHLGAYRDASWSPFGRFVVGARSNELAALEPTGRVRWTLARAGVRFPRWAGTPADTRIAYFARDGLHVVAGDGTGDHLVSAAAVPLAPPAWRQLASGAQALAFVGLRGRVTVVDPDAGGIEYELPPLVAPRALAWSPSGTLAVASRNGVDVYAGRRRIAHRHLTGVSAVAFAPDGRAVAVLHGNEVLLYGPRLRAPRRLFAGSGRLAGLAWSPDGRWLLVGWPSANQWLFVRTTGRHRLVAVSNVSEQFGSSAFPRVAGWCCSTS